MSEKRKSYDKEFKLSAVKMITEAGMSLSQVSRDLGVNESSLHKWKKDYLSDQQNAFPGKGRMKPEEEELRKVKKQLSRVTMERNRAATKAHWACCLPANHPCYLILGKVTVKRAPNSHFTDRWPSRRGILGSLGACWH